ncbi:MAG: M28 family metallopeptidase [Bacteroidia bacterium]
MKLRFYSFFLLLLTSSAWAQTENPAALLREARKEVNVLCSNKMAGRGYIASGHQKAADYLAKRFQEIGLQPIAQYPDSNDVVKPYQQPFIVNLNIIEKTRLYVDDKMQVPGIDYIVAANCPSSKGSAEIQDAGYAMLPISKATGKAISYNDGIPDSIGTDATKKEKYKNELSPINRMIRIETASPTVCIVQKAKLTHTFRDEQGDFPIFEILKDKYPSYAKKITWEVVSNLSKIETQNVLGYLEGKSKKDSFIIVSAHYDHLGRMGTATFPGANDNASGIAMLLSMAEYLVSQPLEYSVLFIAFGAEEAGLLGSQFYVEKQAAVPLAKTKFILNIDLMGGGTEGIMAVGGIDFPQYFDKLKALNETNKELAAVKARKNAPNSDHYFFLQKGVKGFFIYTMGGPPHYHDVYDTPKNLQLSKFVEVRKLLLSFLQQI